jgi:hypothetical protein
MLGKTQGGVPWIALNPGNDWGAPSPAQRDGNNLLVKLFVEQHFNEVILGDVTQSVRMARTNPKLL